MSHQQPMVQLVQLAQGPLLTTVATAATAAALQQQQQQQQLIHHQQPSMLSYPFNGQFIINQATGQPQLIAYSPITAPVDASQAIQVIPSPNAGHMLVPSDQHQHHQQQQQQQAFFHHQQQQQQQMQILQFTNGAKYSSPQFVQFNPVATQVPTQVIFNPATGQIIGQLTPSPVANIGPFQVINALTHGSPSNGPAATAIAIQTPAGNIIPQSAQATILQSSAPQQHQNLPSLPSTALMAPRAPVAVVSSALTTSLFPTCSSTNSSLSSLSTSSLSSSSSSASSSSSSTSPSFSSVLPNVSSAMSSVVSTHDNNKLQPTTTTSAVSSLEATRIHVQQIIQQEKQKLLELKSFYKGHDSTASSKVQINPIVKLNTCTAAASEDKQICIVKSISPPIDRDTSPCNSIKDDAIINDKWDDDSCNIDTGDDHDQSNDESVDSEVSLCRTIEGESSASGDTGTQSTIRQIQSSSVGCEVPRIVDGVNLQEVKEFANMFKTKRLNFGLTQTQVGLALAQSQGPTYSQSAICRFEKLEITPKSALKIMPVLKEWMTEAEKRYNKGDLSLTDVAGSESSKKRKRRTSFSPGALELLNNFFTTVSTHPIPAQMTELAKKLDYDREVIRVWFCNKRQALKNTVRRIESNNNHINGDNVNNFNSNNTNNNNNNNASCFEINFNSTNGHSSNAGNNNIEDKCLIKQSNVSNLLFHK